MYPVDDDLFFLFLGEVSGHGLEVAVAGEEYVGVRACVFGGCLVEAVQHDEVCHVFFGAGVGGLYDGAGGFPDSREFLAYGCLGEVAEYQDIREVEAGFQFFAPGGYLGLDPVQVLVGVVPVLVIYECRGLLWCGCVSVKERPDVFQWISPCLFWCCGSYYSREGGFCKCGDRQVLFSLFSSFFVREWFGIWWILYGFVVYLIKHGEEGEV